MIFNLVDDDSKRFGKKAEFGMFGMFNRNKSDARIFDELAKGFEKGKMDAGDFDKAIKHLSKSNQILAKDIRDTKTGVGEASAAFSGQADTLKRSTGALKAFGKSLGNVALNMGIMLLATLAIRGAITVFDELFTTTKEYKEQLAELGGEYEALKSSIESLNGELETTQASHYYNTLE